MDRERVHGKPVAYALALALLLLCAAGAAKAEDAEAKEDEPQSYGNLVKALKDGRYGVALRYRFAFVADDLFADDAQASTLRTTLFYESARFHRIRAFLEFQDVSNLGFADDHNDTSNGVTDRPVVPDPDGTEVLQGWLAWDGLRDTEITAGRKTVNLDDQRHIGSVPWRQNYQALDLAMITQSSVPRTDLTYAYVDNVKSVLLTNRPMTSHLFNAAIDAGTAGTVVAYYYHLDFEDLSLATFSSDTVGGSFAGKVQWGDVRIPYRFELARQTDAGSNPGRIDATYGRLQLGADWNGFRFLAGYELLGGSADDGQFNTPLATLHKFNGWADLFLKTPTDGLEDLFLSAGYGKGRFSGVLIYHRFEADSSSDTYGDEIDGMVTWDAPWKQSFSFKFALFDGRDGFPDVEKFWLFTSFKFGSE